MKTRNTLTRTALIAASIIVLIVNTNDTAVASPSEAIGANALSAATINAESGFLSSLTAVVPGLYDLSFRVYRNGVLEPVSRYPAQSREPLVLFAHVEDTNGNPAQSGTVSFEYCGNYEPKETCDAGLASWTRLGRMSIGSCYCRSCGGLPGYDPGPGNACLFVFGNGRDPGDDGFRYKYTGKRNGVDSGMSGAANFTWTAAQ